MSISSKADQIRNEVMRVAIKNGQGHIAPSLSCVEILTALFYDVMRQDDKFILSKSHGGYAYYAILSDKGIIPVDVWERFNLPGCVERRPEYGILAGCGALGHGLPMATGLAFSLKLQGLPVRVFCLLGDGEMQEGSNWEAMQFASFHKLSNLFILIDDNGLQAMDRTTNVLARYRSSLLYKMREFGIHTFPLEYDDAEIISALIRAIDPINAPKGLIVETVKGKGMKCSENVPYFHYRLPACQTIANQS